MIHLTTLILNLFLKMTRQRLRRHSTAVNTAQMALEEAAALLGAGMTALRCLRIPNLPGFTTLFFGFSSVTTTSLVSVNMSLLPSLEADKDRCNVRRSIFVMTGEAGY